jgi:hypothetical protein
MRTRHAGQASTRAMGPIRSLTASLAGVVVLLAGLGFLLVPGTPAAAAPPVQGYTTTQAPLPNDQNANPQVYTASTSCPVSNGCVVVGWYDDTSNRPWGLIEQQNGTTWTETQAPQPNNAGSGVDQGLWLGSSQCGVLLFDELCRAVSCPTATTCYAVGQYLDTAGHSEPVIETLSNGTWSSTEGPLPTTPPPATDAGPNFPDAFLMSVSCASATSCVAVGQYEDTSGNIQGLIATLSGTTWSAQAAPFPSGQSASLDQSILEGVSCPTVTFCAASGFFVDTSSQSNGWLVTLANGTWTGVRAPEPSDAGGDPGGHQLALLPQVSCPSPTACVAVGLYLNASSQTFPLLDSWNGSGWTDNPMPLPNNAGSAPTSPQQLTAVSCGSPVSCVAVGFYLDTGNHPYGLIETLSNGTWTPTEAPQPSNFRNTGSFANLREVSCPTPAFCVTDGFYTTLVNSEVGMLDTFSGGRWSTSALPTPSNVTPNTGLQSAGRTVGCYSPVSCAMAGNYVDTSGHVQGFLDTWTGAQGYWLDASDGGIFTYPNNIFFGSTGGLKLNAAMVGMATTPDAQGYWLVGADGGIFSFGDAVFQGSRGGQPLNKPIVGMAPTPTGGGYWLVASDGGIFNYGDAVFYGSRGGQPINAPIVGMAPTADGKGYWLVGADGGIYSYGDALFYGSTGSLKLNKPVVGMAATPTGLGYWLVASDGGIFNYGDANFYGSTGGMTLNNPAVGMASSPSGTGYWLVASDGGVFNYGDAPFAGSAGGMVLNKPVVGMAGG